MKSNKEMKREKKAVYWGKISNPFEQKKEEKKLTPQKKKDKS